jgi:hypothetical protein
MEIRSLLPKIGRRIRSRIGVSAIGGEMLAKGTHKGRDRKKRQRKEYLASPSF